MQGQYGCRPLIMPLRVVLAIHVPQGRIEGCRAIFGIANEFSIKRHDVVEPGPPTERQADVP